MATPKAQTRKKDHSGSPNTPLSPSVMTRRDEKDQMVNLNNRLAIYIEKIRSLESENHRLHVQISSYEETSTVEITNLKGMYENEISEARRLLDELAKEKAQLQIEGSSLKDRADAEKTRASDLARENSVLEVKLKEISKRMRTKEVQTANAIKERDDAVEELDSLKGKFADLTQELETTRQLLEQETLQRVDYENKLQSLKEELHFKEKLHHEEVKESRKRHAFSVTEIDERVKMDYDSKMEASLADLREQQACDIEQLKDDLEGQYKLKISALRSQTDSSRRALMQMQEGNKSSELKIDRLQTSVQLMQNENNILSNKIRDLEGKLDTAEEVKRAAVTVVERERNEARIRLEEMESEYAELLNLKLNLDMEIATYRKLLEDEESRLNISPSPAGDSKSRTRAGRKRKRAGQIESQQISQKAKKQDSTTTTITSETVTVEQTTRQRVEGDPETGDEKTCTIM